MKKSQIVIGGVLLIFFSFFLNAQAAPQTELKTITLEKSEQEAVCRIECTKPVSYESFSLLNPNRLVLDLSKIEEISASPEMLVNDFGILKITTSTQSAETGRLVIYFLGDILQYKILETDIGLNVVFTKAEDKTEEPVEETEHITIMAKPVPSTTQMLTPVQEKAVAPAGKGHVKDMSISANGGMYYFQGEEFESLYSKSANFFRGELTFRIPIPVNNIDFWLGVSSFEKTGQTSLYAEDLKLTWTTFSGALRFIRKFGIFAPFVGVGVDYITYEEIYPASFNIISTGGSNIGMHIQGGLYVHIFDALSVKAMIRYLDNTTTSNNIEMNMGGVEYSFGLTFHFDLQ
ncbi:MAG: AMIN domain-containing protein [Candidatus Aminicenantes bacterium]|nr:AMIN domain-containing protein [Candidatus Aminicenantes bacterium]